MSAPSTRVSVPSSPLHWGCVASIVWFFFLLGSRWGDLDSPPYVEHFGWWTEASYLADTDFDYKGLAMAPHGSVGGPRAYLSSALPSLVAVTMTRFSPEVALAIVHLVTFAAAGGVVGTMVGLLIPSIGVPRALFAGLVMGTIPIFRVQSELTSMDMLMLGALMPSWILLSRRKIVTASLASFPAFLVKNSAFLFPAAIAAYGFGLLVHPRSTPSARKRGVVIFVTSTLLVVVEYAITVLAGNTESRVRFFFDWALWIQSTPDLLLFTFIGFILSLVYLRRQSIRCSTSHSSGPSSAWEQESLLIVGWLLLGLNHFAILATAFEARYLLIALPIILLSIPLAGQSIVPRPVVTLLFVGWLAWNLASPAGECLPTLHPQARRGWGIPERSLEYRADHESNIRLARVIEEQGSNRDVLACEQFVYFLQLPRLGYVSKGLAGDPPPYFFVTEHANVAQLLDDAPSEIVVAYVPSQLGDLAFPAYRISPPAEGDEVIAKDNLVPQNVVYIRRLGERSTWAERCRALVNLLFASAKELDAATRLAIVGFEDQARRLVGEEIGEEPLSVRVTYELRKRLEYLAERASRRVQDPATQSRLEDLDRIVQRRINELKKGEKLAPLTWEERGLDPFIPQRFRYIPSS